MSGMDADDFVVTSSDAGAASPSAPEAVARPAAPDSAHEPEGTADVSSATDPETHETPDQGRERGADGKFAPKRNAIQERIDKAVRAQREAERQVAEMRAEVEQYRSRTQAPPAPAERPAAAPQYDATKGPQLAEFDNYEDWVDARAEWKAEQKWQRIQAESAEVVAKQKHEQAVRAHSERIEAFAAKTPDYRERIQEAARLPVSVAMEAAIIASDHGPAIAYFLATHPEEGARLALKTRSVPASAADFVRDTLEALVVNASQTASTGPVAGGHRPNVPAPIKPVGAAPVVSDPPIEDLPIDEYVERMNARDAAARRTRTA
jgi:hypothetical protein